MTTFTSEDRINATKLVEEAPYHPGYEDAVVVGGHHTNLLLDELNEFRRMDAKYKKFAKTIIEFLKNGQKWDR